ncbi:DUF4334 domain-containing protein [Planococcus sp. CP5-4]|uniref:DUF4334 domain-containing protein n=1 Tax=unclassified Planococcus (in: firmicutes) TaxID=2662419 RepID=UPI001C215ED6|nr:MULTISPECIES: DUF4334 domain-containing protein [unclassified Planococcus (in: firmicutes)]MBU9673264.1 DUF4334 domain-containing protein [Planococcus sp. CP5-4_YE]MBW6062572.1 DUF4334 domain-containing protein [Planococcus sp. CP5-4]
MKPEHWAWELMEHGAGNAGEVCRLFDALVPVDPHEMFGIWRGRELPSGHPLDGWLIKSGWYGKAFHSIEHVDPLLFNTPFGKPFPLHPFPPGLIANHLSGARGAARLRKMEWRGKVSAVMIYDQLPIHDHFRKVNDDVLLGMMDWKGMKRPYFFLLARVYD